MVHISVIEARLSQLDFHEHHLRNITSFAQQRVSQIRQHQQQGPQEIIQPVQNRAPSMYQAYNYGQKLQFKPPIIPVEERKRLPSPHMPRIMGAAAVHGARNPRVWVNPNPYAGGSLMVRGRVSSRA
jgi:hypothetical protein